MGFGDLLWFFFIFSALQPVLKQKFLEASRQRMIAETSSGALAFGIPNAHLAVPGLPFGGVGESGLGRYHGSYSLDTFSHTKGTFRQTRLASADLLTPPYDAWFRRIVRFVIRYSGG